MACVRRTPNRLGAASRPHAATGPANVLHTREIFLRSAFNRLSTGAKSPRSHRDYPEFTSCLLGPNPGQHFRQPSKHDSSYFHFPHRRPMQESIGLFEEKRIRATQSPHLPSCRQDEHLRPSPLIADAGKGTTHAPRKRSELSTETCRTLGFHCPLSATSGDTGGSLGYRPALALHLRLVVHHVREADVPRRSPLPQNPFARFALVSLLGAAGAVVLLGVAVFGGLESANALAEPEPAGTELENDLFRVSPHEVRVFSDDLGDRLQLRVDIEMHGSERPVSTFDAGRAMVVHLQPAEEISESPEILFQRRPGANVSHLQPHMPEADAIISWELPEGVDPGAVESVVVAVHEIQRLEARDGGSILWVAGDGLVGAVSVPLEGADQ